MSPPRATTRSSGRPSSSAATIRAVVRVPVPMSWMPGRDERAAVGVDPHGRVRGWPAAAPPDLRRAAHPAQKPVGLLLAERAPRAPARELGGAVVAREEALARIGKAGCLVAVDVVQAAQLERIELELRGELVDRLLEHGHALDDPGGAERVLRSDARLHGERHRADVGAGVERERRLRGPGRPSLRHPSRPPPRARSRSASRRSARRA